MPLAAARVDGLQCFHLGRQSSHLISEFSEICLLSIQASGYRMKVSSIGIQRPQNLRDSQAVPLSQELLQANAMRNRELLLDPLVVKLTREANVGAGAAGHDNAADHSRASTRMTCVAPHEPVPRAVGMPCAFSVHPRWPGGWLRRPPAVRGSPGLCLPPLCCALNTGALSRGTPFGRSVGDGPEELPLASSPMILRRRPPSFAPRFLACARASLVPFRDHAGLKFGNCNHLLKQKPAGGALDLREVGEAAVNAGL